MDVPSTMFAWQMYGAGFENFGKNDQPVTIPVPEPGAGELLVKIEAIGLCFSDVKLIRAGEEHPRVRSKNLKEDPVIPGHEAVMSIVKVGKNLESKFKPGQRFIIQADIYYKGEGWAYGYALNGGMEQYSLIGEKVLNGDEGCYLIPLTTNIPSAIAALLEPWTCVLASYRISHRTAPLDGGKMGFVFAAGATVPELGSTVAAAKPAEVLLTGAVPAGFEKILAAAYPAAKVQTVSEFPEGFMADDLFLCGTAEASKYGKFCAVNAVISMIGDFAAGVQPLDVGSVHYKGWFYQGTATNELSKAYGRNVRAALKKGGTCWLSGGAGAMGQMHTQLAVTSPDGPSKILVTDMDDTRIANVEKLLRPAAEARGIEFKLLNPSKLASPADFVKLLKEFAPEGFDDIVMLVPVPAVLSDATQYLAEDGLMNIFAGIPAGKEAQIPMDAIHSAGVRYIGSSGSRTEDLKHTLALAEAGKLDPETALAAIGGMKSLKKGLECVAGAKFPGKTVIFPNCPDMPLVPKTDLPTLGDEIGKSLCGGKYCGNTEKAILEKYGVSK